jgi:hypothetical protein
MVLLTLKDYIYERLVEASSVPVYDIEVPKNGTYPCLVYAFTGFINKSDTQDKRILTIDYWDITGDNSTILEVSNTIRDAFDYSWQSENGIFFRIFLDWESEIPDQESYVKRIQQNYLVKGW